MDEKPTSTNIDARYRVLLIIWFAILNSIVLFFVLTFVIERNHAPDDNRVLIIVLTAIGTFLSAASIVPKQKFLQQAVEQQRPQLVVTAYIIAFGLSEMGALFGLLLFFLTNDRYYYLLFILSALFMLVHLPRREHMLDASSKGQPGEMNSQQ